MSAREKHPPRVVTLANGCPVSAPAVLSLFDRSGAWPRPYAEAGASVLTVDLLPALPGTMYEGREHRQCDVRALNGLLVRRGGIILAAPPCDHFAGSGARWWAAKDADGRTADAVALIRWTLDLIRQCEPRVWTLENPIGRLRRLVPELGKPLLTFNPCDYGDPYTKRTQLFGVFNPNLPRTQVEPQRVCSQGSWVQKLGGRSERTKVLRSTTPAGFARAFCSANPIARAEGGAR